jgi:hypothetical protein
MCKLMVLRLFMHEIDLAFSRALLRAGRSMEVRIAMMAITTSNSIRVKDFFISVSFLFRLKKHTQCIENFNFNYYKIKLAID